MINLLNLIVGGAGRLDTCGPNGVAASRRLLGSSDPFQQSVKTENVLVATLFNIVLLKFRYEDQNQFIAYRVRFLLDMASPALLVHPV